MGTVERCVLLNHGPDDQSIEVTEKAWELLELELHADAARRFAVALAEAADEMEEPDEDAPDDDSCTD